MTPFRHKKTQVRLDKEAAAIVRKAVETSKRSLSAEASYIIVNAKPKSTIQR